jgi:hypothetical protein
MRKGIRNERCHSPRKVGIPCRTVKLPSDLAQILDLAAGLTPKLRTALARLLASADCPDVA